jgi:hypothetical protein
MANIRSYGFKWVKSLYGGSRLDQVVVPKRVASGYQATDGNVTGLGSRNVDLCIGDPVQELDSGYVQLSTIGSATYGVIVGFLPFYDSSQGFMRYGSQLPGNTTYTAGSDQESIVLVCPVPGQVFEIDADDASTAATRAAYIALVGENCDHTWASDATLKRANPVLDISDHKTATAGWRIHGISPRMDLEGDYTAVGAKLWVTCNEVQNAPFVTSGSSLS